MRLHHVGIVTDDIKSGIERHRVMFNLHPVSKIVKDTNQNVSVVLLSTHGRRGISVELIAPLTKNSPVSSILRKGHRLYHVCFEVDDIEKALSNARKQGAIVVSGASPAKLFNGKRIAFIYSRDRYLVEFLEK